MPSFLTRDAASTINKIDDDDFIDDNDELLEYVNAVFLDEKSSLKVNNQ